MRVARIKNNIVVNIENVSEDFIEKNNGIDGYIFVESKELQSCQRKGLPRDRGCGHVGLRWTKEFGFEQPKYDEDYGKITSDEFKISERMVV